MITAQEIIEKVEPHDMPVLEVIKSEHGGFTLIQVANKLKRARADVKHSLYRLIIGKQIKLRSSTRKYYDPNFSFLPECMSKRPEEYAKKYRELEQENERLKSERDELLNLSDRIVTPALTLAKHDYPLSSLAGVALTDWKAFINKVSE